MDNSLILNDSSIDFQLPYGENGERLADIYDEGQEWDNHKARAQAMGSVIEEALGYRYATEVEHCSKGLLLQRELESGKLAVRRFKACRRRWCPVCAWRKSLRQWARLTERLPGLIEKHGPVRWLLLTLTVRNCSLDDLPATVSAMSKGFRQLTNKATALGRAWPASGWLKALEITFPRENEAHPHFHVLLAVKPSYFKVGYIPQAEWAERWRRAMRLDYTPVVDVRRVKPLGSGLAEQIDASLAEALGGLREVSKYVLKPGEEDSPDALRGLLSLKGKRFIDGGGWLRGVLRDDEPADEVDQIEPKTVEDVDVFWWQVAESLYRRKAEMEGGAPRCAR